MRVDVAREPRPPGAKRRTQPEEAPPRAAASATKSLIRGPAGAALAAATSPASSTSDSSPARAQKRLPQGVTPTPKRREGEPRPCEQPAPLRTRVQPSPPAGDRPRVATPTQSPELPNGSLISNFQSLPISYQLVQVVRQIMHACCGSKVRESCQFAQHDRMAQITGQTTGQIQGTYATRNQ